MDDNRKKALTAALSQIEKQFGKGAVMRMGDDSSVRNVDVISSGSLALDGHRARRDKTRQRSALEDIAGVGAKRRRDLLRHFGSAQGVENANIEELKKVAGISATMAQQIYDHLHNIGD